jgi:hypothetical protein
MALMHEAFELLMRGGIVSVGSTTDHEVANYLSVEEHFEAMDETVQRLGYRLVGENGYFFLARTGRMGRDEVESFVTRHKRLIVAVSLLKHIRPLVSPGDRICETELIAALQQREDEGIEEKMNYLFGDIDRKSRVEEFFKLLRKHRLIERYDSVDKDSYRVLEALNYYTKIVESLF